MEKNQDLGKKPTTRRFTPEELETIKTMFVQGHSGKAIARHLKAGSSSIQAQINKYKAQGIGLKLPENPTIEPIYETYGEHSSGITTLEHFAGHAITGIMSNIDIPNINHERDPEILAELAFKIGFSMLKTREKYLKMYQSKEV